MDIRDDDSELDPHVLRHIEWAAATVKCRSCGALFDLRKSCVCACDALFEPPELAELREFWKARSVGG